MSVLGSLRKQFPGRTLLMAEGTRADPVELGARPQRTYAQLDYSFIHPLSRQGPLRSPEEWEQMIEAARLEEGKLELSTRRVDLREVARLAVEMAQPFTDSSHAVVFESPDIEVPVMIFPQSPRQLVRISAQVYNSEEEYARLAAALPAAARGAR